MYGSVLTNYISEWILEHDGMYVYQEHLPVFAMTKYLLFTEQ